MAGPWEKYQDSEPMGQASAAKPWEKYSTGEKSGESGKLDATTGQNRGIIDKLVGLTGPRYQTWPERAVREMAGIPEKAITAAASAPPGTREATEAMVGPAAETALATLAPEARVGRAAVKGAAPEVEELLGGYKGADAVMNTPIQDHVLPELKKNILDALHDEHFRDYLSPSVYRAVEELAPVEGKSPTIMDIEGVRRVLGNVPHTEGKAAGIARDKINEYLSGIQPDDIHGGSNAGQVLTEIRGNYAAGKRGQLIATAEDKGMRRAEKSGSGANLDNTLRQEIDRILNNPKLLRGFSKDEIEQMRKIVKGGAVGNIARLLSKFGPKHPITGWGAAGASALHGDMGLGAAGLAAGTAAQKISEGSTLRKIRELEESVRRRSPLGQQQQAPLQPPGMPPVAPFAFRGGVADLLQRLGPEQQ